MQMLATNIAHSSISIQAPIRGQVYEYALTVVNPQDNDTQELTAAFTSLPTVEDWQRWLSGWNSCGYSPVAEPQLIRTM